MIVLNFFQKFRIHFEGRYFVPFVLFAGPVSLNPYFMPYISAVGTSRLVSAYPPCLISSKIHI
jgi:hypothetical protein